MALDTETGIVKPEEGFNIIKAAAQQRASNTQAALDVHKLMDQQQEAYKSAEFAATTVGNANVAISNETESWKAASDAKKAAENLALGFDPLDQGSKSNYWIQQMHENAAKSYAALDVVNESKSKTLLNDPLGYIAAQFTLPADIATQHYYADKYNVAEGALNEIIQASSASSVAINQSQQTTSQAAAIAHADKASAEAAKNVAELKLMAAGTQVKGVLELNSLNEKQLAIAVQVHAAQNSDAHLALARQSAADSHAMHLRNMEVSQLALDKKQDDVDGWTAQMENYNAGARASGKITYDSVSAFKAQALKVSGTSEYKTTVVRGMQINANGGNPIGVPVAETAGAAAAFYATPGTSLVGNVAGSFLANEWNKAKLLPGASKDPAALAARVDLDANAEALRQRTGIDNSNPQLHNIYQAPIPAVLFQMNAVKSNPFLTETLAPMVALDKRTTITDATLLAKAADYAKGGGANFNMAAAGIATYYNAAVAENTKSNMYVENGLPPQINYIAKIDGRNIDLTKEADVKRAMFLLSGRVSLGSSPFGFR